MEGFDNIIALKGGELTAGDLKKLGTKNTAEDEIFKTPLKQDGSLLSKKDQANEYLFNSCSPKSYSFLSGFSKGSQLTMKSDPDAASERLTASDSILEGVDGPILQLPFLISLEYEKTHFST
jgi:hypothetical protein